MTPTSAADRFLRQGPTGAAGFTLLELLVVLALILIGVGLIVPNIATTANSAFNADLRQAVAILKYARRVAIVEGSPQAARFMALDQRSADFEQQRAAWQRNRTPSDWVSDYIMLQFHSELNQQGEDRSEIEVVFFPQGGSTGGVLAFSADELHGEIRIDPITGRIAAAYNGEKLDEEALDAAF
jgi:general secretion pathway protein H